MKTIKAKVHRLPAKDKAYHLYITTDEDPKKGDWVINLASMDTTKYSRLSKVDKLPLCCNGKHYKKIIATTDPKLLKGTNWTEADVQGHWECTNCGEWTEDLSVKCKCKPVNKIPQSFIEEYCKTGGIDEVLVSVDSYLNIPVETSVKFNDWLPSTLKEYEGLKGQVIWGVEDRLDAGNHCIKVEFLNKYNKNCKLYASVSHWYESIKHLYYHKIAIDSNNTIIIHPVEEKMYSREEVGSKIKEFVKEYAYEWDMDDINEWIEENL